MFIDPGYGKGTTHLHQTCRMRASACRGITVSTQGLEPPRSGSAAPSSRRAQRCIPSLRGLHFGLAGLRCVQIAGLHTCSLRVRFAYPFTSHDARPVQDHRMLWALPTPCDSAAAPKTMLDPLPGQLRAPHPQCLQVLPEAAVRRQRLCDGLGRMHGGAGSVPYAPRALPRCLLASQAVPGHRRQPAATPRHTHHIVQACQRPRCHACSVYHMQ